MSYEDMSDFDLDCKVAEIVFNGCTPYKDSSSGLCMVNLNKPMEDDIYFNPRSNPSDAWPIIQSAGISLVFMGDYWEAHALINEDEAHNTQDENPLRAAMIVYLMMKGEL